MHVVEGFAAQGEVGDVGGGGDDVIAEGGRGERAHAAEDVLVGEGGKDSLSAAHGKAGDGGARPVREGGVGRVDVGHQAADKFAPREVVGCGEVGGRPARLAFVRIDKAVYAHDYHRARSVEAAGVLSNDVRVHGKTVYIARPGGIVTAQPVQQIEHGIANVFVVVGGQNYRGMAVGARYLRAVGYAFGRGVGASFLL